MIEKHVAYILDQLTFCTGDSTLATTTKNSYMNHVSLIQHLLLNGFLNIWDCVITGLGPMYCLFSMQRRYSLTTDVPFGLDRLAVLILIVNTVTHFSIKGLGGI